MFEFCAGAVHGPEKCPAGACSECEGHHHWIEVAVDPDNPGEYKDHPAFKEFLCFYSCKHCDAWAEMEDMSDCDESSEDEDSEEEGYL
jgi:hypothetical protein